MPDEPNNQIDGLLKAWAKKRREDAGAPLDLHPATRKLLQGEVARVYPQKNSPAPRRAAWLTILWPRAAFALGIFIVLAVAVVNFWPGGKLDRTSQFARNETLKAPQPAGEFDDAYKKDAPKPVAESLASDKRESDRKRSLELADAVALKSEVGRVDANGAALSRQKEVAIAQQSREGKQLASAPSLSAPSPAKAKVLADRETEKLNADTKLAERSEPSLAKSVDDLKRANANALAGGSAEKNFKVPADQQPVPTQTSPANTLALQPAEPATTTAFFAETQNSVAQNAGATAQRFYRGQAGDEALRRNLNKDGGAAQVLNVFSFSQTGNGVQIVDGDGSVYNGQLQPVAAVAGELGARGASRDLDQTTKLRVASPASKPAAPVQNSAPATQWFRVSGTNRSLQQLVEFTGNFVMTNAVAVFANGSEGFGGNANVAPANSPATPALTVAPASRSAAETRARASVKNVPGQSFRTNGVTPVSISAIQGVVRIGGTNEQKVNAVRQPAAR